jgi:hypothetical protein
MYHAEKIFSQGNSLVQEKSPPHKMYECVKFTKNATLMVMNWTFDKFLGSARLYPIDQKKLLKTCSNKA